MSVFIGAGGAGGILINLLATNPLAGALQARGTQLLYVDGLRDDARVRIQPGNRGVDTGPSSSQFLLSDQDPFPVLRRASEGLRAPAAYPWLSPEDAKILVKSPPPAQTAAGTSRVWSAVAADLSLPNAIDSLRNVIDLAVQHEVNGDPTVFMMFGSGGHGPGHAPAYLTKLRELGPARLQIWAVIVGPKAYERYFEPEQITELKARFVAVVREINALPPGIVNIKCIAGGGSNPYAASEPIDGILPAIAAFFEGWVLEDGEFRADSANLAGGDLTGVPADESHMVVGGAKIEYAADWWAELLAARAAAEGWRRVTTLTANDRLRASALLDTIASSADPVRLAEEIRIKGDPAFCAPFEVQTVEQLEARITAENSEPAPQVPGLSELVHGMNTIDLINLANTELTRYLDDLGAWVERNRAEVREAFIANLRQVLAAELAGPDNDGYRLSDPAIVARLEHAHEVLASEMREAADQLETAVSDIVAVSDPVGTAQQVVDEKAASFGPHVNRRKARAYLELVRGLGNAQRWLIMERAALAQFRDVASTLDEARVPFRALIGAAREFEAFERITAAGQVDRLRAYGARPSTGSIPTVDGGGEKEFERAVMARLTHDGRDLTGELLSRLRVVAALPPTGPVSQWNLQLSTPPIPGYVEGRTLDATSADGHPERIAALAPGYLGMLAQQSLKPVCHELTIDDVLAFEFTASEHGSATTPANIERFVRERTEKLLSAGDPLATVVRAELDGRPAGQPLARAYTFYEGRPAGSPLAEQIRNAMQATLHPVHAGFDGVIRRSMIVNRVALSRIPEHHDAVKAYHQAKKPLHTNCAVKEAWKLERRAIAAGRMEEGRLLDQSVVDLLAHPNELRAAVSLMAFGRLETRPDADDFERMPVRDRDRARGPQRHRAARPHQRPRGVAAPGVARPRRRLHAPRIAGALGRRAQRAREGARARRGPPAARARGSGPRLRPQRRDRRRGPRSRALVPGHRSQASGRVNRTAPPHRRSGPQRFRAAPRGRRRRMPPPGRGVRVAARMPTPRFTPPARSRRPVAVRLPHQRRRVGIWRPAALVVLLLALAVLLLRDPVGQIGGTLPHRLPSGSLIGLPAADAPGATPPPGGADLNRWQALTISYRDGSSYPHAVAEAVQMWNALPAPVRFVPTGPGERADVEIGDADKNVDWAGLTTSTVERHTIIAARIELNRRWLPSDDANAVDTAAHELGHALGLPHQKSGCSLMRPTGLSADPCHSATACGPQPDDLKALVARYGGSTEGFSGTRCRPH